MIVNQEEGSKFEDYYYDRVHKALRLIEETSTETVLDTDTLKIVLEETQKILKDYNKYIEDFEKKEDKKSKQEAIRAKMRGFDD